MNNEQKAQRYEWLTNQLSRIQRQIQEVPKLPIEQTLQDLNSVEYSDENQLKIDQLNEEIRMINEDLRVLMTAI